MSYVKIEYPKWVYHQEKAPKGIIVKNEKEKLELGEGWVDTPAKFNKENEDGKIKKENEKALQEIVKPKRGRKPKKVIK